MTLRPIITCTAILVLSLVTIGAQCDAQWLSEFFVSGADSNLFVRPGETTNDLHVMWTRCEDNGEKSTVQRFECKLDGCQGKLLCFQGVVVVCDVMYDEGTSLVVPRDDGMQKGMDGFSGLLSRKSKDGCVCLIEMVAQKAPLIERVRFCNAELMRKRMPCSFFAVEGLCLGMLKEEEAICRKIMDNAWNTSNAAMHAAALVHPVLGLVGLLLRDTSKGLRVEYFGGMVSKISRHYAPKAVADVGGYDVLRGRVMEKLGNPTVSKRSKYYVYQRSDIWDLKDRDFKLALKQEEGEVGMFGVRDGNPTCTLEISSPSIKHLCRR